MPVIRKLASLLEEFREQSRHWRGSASAKLFPGRVPGTSLTTRQANARFERWRSAAGLRKELTIHSLRAGFATALHRESGDLLLVSRALGHRDIRQTLRYVAPQAEALAGVIERGLVCVVPV